MAKHGIKFIEGAVPSVVKKSTENDALKYVEYKNSKTGEVIGHDNF